MTMLALSVSYAGFVALYLSMPRYRRAIVFTAPAAFAARATGYLLIGLALWPCVFGWSGSVGIVVWLGMLSVAALLLVALLSRESTFALVIAVMAPPISLALTLLLPAARA